MLVVEVTARLWKSLRACGEIHDMILASADEKKSNKHDNILSGRGPDAHDRLGVLDQLFQYIM